MSWSLVVAAVVIGAHGIGHVLGWGPPLGLSWTSSAESPESWLVEGTVARTVAVLLFGFPTLGFLACAVGLCADLPWLRVVAVVSAVTSLIAAAVFPHALPLSSLFGSTIVNVAVIVLLGVLDLPSRQ
jgi:UPF0716 family protein affecting phage T7 exclusion